MPTAKRDIPTECRENILLSKRLDRHNRDAYRDNAKFLNLDQWEPSEAQKRNGKRLMLTADQLNAPVDQVVNGVRQNKPGPDVAPEGSGADQDAADVFSGLLRRIDYDNSAWVAFEIAFENATGCNFGCWAVDLEYKNDRSFERVIKVRAIPNANETVFFDPLSIKKDRSDALWAAEVTIYSEDLYRETFGQAALNKLTDRGPLQLLREYYSSVTDESMAGWITEKGIQIAKYWKVEIERDILRLYTNGIAYWDSEKKRIPKRDSTGQEVVPHPAREPRDVMRRSIKWYITNGTEILKEGVWTGDGIPLYPVYGRERWVDGKRYIFSMIQAAKQAQQAFNYAFTGACEVLATTTKAPWLGLLGKFKSKRAQWEAANKELQAYMEFDAVELPDGTWHTEPPIRDVQEPPIQSFLAFCALCVNAIQRATSIFDPSLGKQKSDQSGKAIQELQEQSSEGNYHWSDNLTIALTRYYKDMIALVQAEYDSAQVVQILRASGTTEEVWINKEFNAGVRPDGSTIIKHHKIADGMYAIAVSVGPSAKTQRQMASMKIDTLIKVLPPEMVAQAADLIAKLHDLGPLGNEIADRWVPPAYRDGNDPRAAAAQLAQAMQQNKAMQAVIQKLQFAIASKAPELQLKQYLGELNALTQIRVAQEKNLNDKGERDAELLEQMLDQAHEAASDSADRVHEQQMAGMQHDHEAEMQENEPEPAAPAQ